MTKWGVTKWRLYSNNNNLIYCLQNIQFILFSEGPIVLRMRTIQPFADALNFWIFSWCSPVAPKTSHFLLFSQFFCKSEKVQENKFAKFILIRFDRVCDRDNRADPWWGLIGATPRSGLYKSPLILIFRQVLVSVGSSDTKLSPLTRIKVLYFCNFS